jgi:hypothetical protein
MMRLGSAEFTLTRISEKDRQVLKDLALSRGCMTIKEFARVHEISVVGARQKIKKDPFDLIFKSIRLTGGAKAPEFFLLRSRYGRIYATTHKEPRSMKTILDALLRFQVQSEGGVWEHNLRHAGVMVLGDCAHITDCLDRSESSVLKLASALKESKKLIHTLSSSRLAAFQMLLSRSRKTGNQKPHEENPITWDDVWNIKAPSIDKKSLPESSTIEFKFHDLAITRNLQV